MKGLLVIVIALAIGIGGHGLYYRAATAPTAAMLFQPQGRLEWLRSEFLLSDEQFERVRAKHQEYASVCDAMCAKITRANARLDEVMDGQKALTPEVEAALEDVTHVQGECQRAMLEHIYAVGAEMPPEQGARYIQMMRGRVIQPGMTSNVVVSESAK